VLTITTSEHTVKEERKWFSSQKQLN